MAVRAASLSMSWIIYARLLNARTCDSVPSLCVSASCIYIFHLGPQIVVSMFEKYSVLSNSKRNSAQLKVNNHLKYVTYYKGFQFFFTAPFDFLFAELKVEKLKGDLMGRAKIFYSEKKNTMLSVKIIFAG